MAQSKEQYNAEPVYYCKHCLSLRVKFIDHLDDSDYCDECGSTNIGQCSIEEWEEMYKSAHKGKSFLNK